jgi:polyisoprenoid-binding protein YceI
MGKFMKLGTVVSKWALLLFLSTGVFAADYKIDLSHAFIQFKISHLGYSTLIGRFNDFEGTFSWDKDDPTSAAIEVNIKTSSIDSNWAERDKHLRGDDFLDVEQFPTAIFKSTSFSGDVSGGKLDGNLTLHGVTKPITLDVKYIGEGDDPWGGYRAGFSAAASLNRGDFDMSYNLGPSSESMTFELFVEGIRE